MHRCGTAAAVLLAAGFAGCGGTMPTSLGARFQANLERAPAPLLCHLAARGVLAARIPARCGRIERRRDASGRNGQAHRRTRARREPISDSALGSTRTGWPCLASTKRVPVARATRSARRRARLNAASARRPSISSRLVCAGTLTDSLPSPRVTVYSRSCRRATTRSRAACRSSRSWSVPARTAVG